MSDERTLLNRRQLLGIFGATLGGAVVGGAANDVDGDGAAGAVMQAGAANMAGLRKVGDGIWHGPLSVRSDVPKEGGNKFIQEDAGANNDRFKVHLYNGGWSPQGFEMPEIATEEANKVKWVPGEITSAELQSIIDDMDSSGGGVVWFRPETDYTLGEIDVKQHVELRGFFTWKSKAETHQVINIEPGANYLFDVRNEAVIRNLKMVGNNSNQDFIRCIDRGRPVFESLRMENTKGYGMKIAGVFNPVFRRIDVADCGYQPNGTNAFALLNPSGSPRNNSGGTYLHMRIGPKIPGTTSDAATPLYIENFGGIHKMYDISPGAGNSAIGSPSYHIASNGANDTILMSNCGFSAGPEDDANLRVDTGSIRMSQCDLNDAQRGLYMTGGTMRITNTSFVESDQENVRQEGGILWMSQCYFNNPSQAGVGSYNQVHCSGNTGRAWFRGCQFNGGGNPQYNLYAPGPASGGGLWLLDNWMRGADTQAVETDGNNTIPHQRGNEGYRTFKAGRNNSAIPIGSGDATGDVTITISPGIDATLNDQHITAGIADAGAQDYVAFVKEIRNTGSGSFDVVVHIDSLSSTSGIVATLIYTVDATRNAAPA